MWHLGKVTFQLNGSLIVLTSDSVPLVYILGSKGGSGVTRAAMEYISYSEFYGSRFRQHEIIIHDQIEFHERWTDQQNGAFGNVARDKPQTRDATCTPSFTSFGDVAKNVTTPGGGAFHAVAYLLETLVNILLLLIPSNEHFKSKIRHCLDVRRSLVAAGEMTNSVQMLMDKFTRFEMTIVPQRSKTNP